MSSLEDRVKQQQQYIANQRQQLQALRDRVERLEQLWEHSINDPEIRWLYQNRTERMDPTIPIFDKGRAEFHLDRYRFASERVKGLTVADIACGTGYGSAFLGKAGGAAQVIGIDISSEAIAYATIRHGQKNVRFECRDACDTNLPSATFDAIVSFETIEHVPDDRMLIDEFARILKPNGILMISTPNQWPLTIAPYHVREYNLENFENVFAERFEILEMHNQNSGTTFQFNRDQAKGIIATTSENCELAECYLAVVKRI